MDPEEMPVAVGNASNRVLAALYAIPHLPGAPALHTGKGRYDELKYTDPNDSTRRSIHIGRTTEAEHHLLTQQIDNYTGTPRRRMFERYREQIEPLNAERKVARLKVRQLAEELGYYFHGRRLRKRNGAPASALTPERHSKLEQLEQSLLALQKITDDLDGMYCTEVISWNFCRRPWRTTIPLMSKQERRGWATMKGLKQDLKALAAAVERVRKELGQREKAHEDTGH